MSFKRLVQARTLRLFGAAAAALAVGSGAPVAGAGADAPTGPALDWSVVNPVHHPPPLGGASAAYDADNSTVVVFGGVEANGSLDDSTWVWNGEDWSEAATADPPARQDASMAFDPGLHELILFGGQGQDGTLLGDTWAWNGASWVEVAADGSGPVAREGAALAYAGNGQLLLFGGTGDAGTTPPSTLPGDTTTANSDSSAGNSSAGAKGAKGAKAANGPTGANRGGGSNQVLAAGTDGSSRSVLGDTWLWTSSGWVESPASGPTARTQPALSYDQADGTAVLFGGASTPENQDPPQLLADTWVWDGTAWAEAQPAASPPARLGAAGDYDPLAGGPLLIGGDGSSGDLLDAWVWSGGSWVTVALTGQGTPREDAASAFDVTTSRMLVFGGSSAEGALLGDTGLLGAVTTGSTAPATSSAAATTTPPTAGGGGPGRVGPNPTTVVKPKSSPTRATSTTHPPSVTTGDNPRIHTSERDLRPDRSVLLTGSGFAPVTTVVLSFHSTPTALGQVVTDPAGDFRVQVRVPDGAATGEHHIQAEGTDASGGPAVLDATVFVAGPGGSSTPLPTTLTLLGLALLIPAAAYAAMGLSSRRRAASEWSGDSET